MAAIEKAFACPRCGQIIEYGVDPCPWCAMPIAWEGFGPPDEDFTSNVSVPPPLPSLGTAVVSTPALQTPVVEAVDMTPSISQQEQLAATAATLESFAPSDPITPSLSTEPSPDLQTQAPVVPQVDQPVVSAAIPAETPAMNVAAITSAAVLEQPLVAVTSADALPPSATSPDVFSPIASLPTVDAAPVIEFTAAAEAPIASVTVSDANPASVASPEPGTSPMAISALDPAPVTQQAPLLPPEPLPEPLPEPIAVLEPFLESHPVSPIANLESSTAQTTPEAWVQTGGVVETAPPPVVSAVPPAEAPEPIPTLVATPVPTAIPTPTATQTPESIPAAIMQSAPAPAPVAAPETAPAPASVAAPETAPAPAPVAAPETAPAPAPVITPEPIPALFTSPVPITSILSFTPTDPALADTAPAPAPAPVPAPPAAQAPAPEPIPTAAPAPVQAQTPTAAPAPTFTSLYTEEPAAPPPPQPPAAAALTEVTPSTFATQDTTHKIVRGRGRGKTGARILTFVFKFMAVVVWAISLYQAITIGISVFGSQAAGQTLTASLTRFIATDGVTTAAAGIVVGIVLYGIGEVIGLLNDIRRNFR